MTLLLNLTVARALVIVICEGRVEIVPRTAAALPRQYRLLCFPPRLVNLLAPIFVHLDISLLLPSSQSKVFHDQAL